MLVLLFVYTIMLSLANAQDYGESGNDDSGAITYSNNSNCISKYRDLQSYVLNNEDLMDNLIENFFETGETLTEFIRITYRFKVLLPVSNHTSNSTDTYDDDDDEFTCMDNQKTFIWSSSALYLLGPKPLFWQTLFAVHVQESRITITLPCLCNDAYDNLLPRLTYLVSGIDVC